MFPPAAGGDPLGQPPPGPTSMNPDGQGMAGPSIRGLAGPGPSIPSGQLPPQILTGITSAAQQITSLLDSFAQVTPDKGMQLAMIKDLLMQYLADLMGAGAQPTSPTASGPAFPGGGMGQGIAGAGAV